MKRLSATFLALIMAFAVSAQERIRFIDEEMLAKFRNIKGTSFDERFLDQDMLQVSLNQDVVAWADTACTYRVPTSRVTDQKKSGRCWYFSVLNILRAEMMARHNLGHFEFSQTYGQFWDVLEKSNRFLENVIDNRSKHIGSRMNDWLFKKPIGDGGHFANAAYLITKYGLVPQEVMPERHSSVDNFRLMTIIRTSLRRTAMALRAADRKDLQKVKEAGLSDIYRILVANLGEPPTEFSWKGKTYTPASFKAEFVPQDMCEDYVVFMNDPTLPYYRRYTVDNSRNCYEFKNWTFLNLPVSELLAMGVESLKNGKMFCFSADTDAFPSLMMGGIYHTDIYNLEDMLGISLDMEKEDLVSSCEIKSAHAVAMAGVELDESGKPVKWLVENSFGEVRGWSGFVVMQQQWLERYLFRFVVEKQFVPEDLLPLLDKKPKVLKSWNPTY